MTPHNEASKGDFAKTVLMPGDPMRAQMIAERYLKDYKLVSDVRNMYAYTGYYKGKLVSIMASGMGIPSIAIYSHELYTKYDVDNIIRIGSCGAYSAYLNLYDTLLVTESYSLSSYAKVLDGYKKNLVKANDMINSKLIDSAARLGKSLIEARVYSSDVFYGHANLETIYKHNKCMAVEMETFGLFYNAHRLNKKAACLLTVSDSLVTGEETSPEERQTAFLDMVEIALDTAINL